MMLSFVLPCYKRPARTRRMLDCIAQQSMTGWEGHIYGDGCSDFASLLESDYYQDWQQKMADSGNVVLTGNMPENGGGHGYTVINKAIQEATGRYFIFLSNDDIITPNHFQHYVDGIEQLNALHSTIYDFSFFNTLLAASNNFVRISNLSFSGCGHSELIIRTEFLKQMPPHGPGYGHDWELIDNMMQRSLGRYRKALSQQCSYEIRSIPGRSIDTID